MRSGDVPNLVNRINIESNLLVRSADDIARGCEDSSYKDLVAEIRHLQSDARLLNLKSDMLKKYPSFARVGPSSTSLVSAPAVANESGMPLSSGMIPGSPFEVTIEVPQPKIDLDLSVLNRSLPLPLNSDAGKGIAPAFTAQVVQEKSILNVHESGRVELPLRAVAQDPVELDQTPESLRSSASVHEYHEPIQCIDELCSLSNSGGDIRESPTEPVRALTAMSFVSEKAMSILGYWKDEQNVISLLAPLQFPVVSSSPSQAKIVEVPVDVGACINDFVTRTGQLSPSKVKRRTQKT